MFLKAPQENIKQLLMDEIVKISVECKVNKNSKLANIIQIIYHLLVACQS
jgi:hypothetical protein